MWNPVKSSEKSERKTILGIAEVKIKQDLEKIQKKIKKLSKELFEMDPFETTQKRMASKRLSLNAECEERDRLERRIELIEKWKGEV